MALGECDAALAGAVLMHSSETRHLEAASLLTSQRGVCFAFDGQADGYVRGEDAGVLRLERFEDALRDGDGAGPHSGSRSCEESLLWKRALLFSFLVCVATLMAFSPGWLPTPLRLRLCSQR
ncbi:Polyketide synthase PksJ (plasmid) [Streptomyces sp. YIM 121038]|uniref:beta-ketoacyl synthase N-terminal-like domain-containing protein n=1 Tax=Streptomyces sp. YIM 121038 TaxID=2136401 RepID=UPI001165812E|nr:beta-ketoacyl synthase N-terminal-like domain-containing protein [Streptomyces sp. YIM 121038]QCX82468.1 Polyketide synthase PksJ [Streptomyces sp. YIM 121038]